MNILYTAICTIVALFYLHYRLSRLENIMTTLAEAVAGSQSYAADLKAQRDSAVAALGEANTRATTASEALAAFQADDAATDAQQLADQARADAEFVQAALDSVQAPPAEPVVEPVAEPAEEPVV